MAWIGRKKDLINIQNRRFKDAFDAYALKNNINVAACKYGFIEKDKIVLIATNDERVDEFMHSTRTLGCVMDENNNIIYDQKQFIEQDIHTFM